METLGRWAPYFAMAGGALFTVTLVVVAFFPTSPVAYGFIVGIVLLGAALPGLYWQTRPATGRLGWASAWLSGLGTLAVVLLGLYGLATSQISLTEQNPAHDCPAGHRDRRVRGVAPRNLGFAVALIRTRALPRLGAWLVLAGALVAVVTAPLTGENSPPAVVLVTTLLFVLFPVGWFLLGYEAWRRGTP